MTHLLFVYGSLRPGEDNDESRALAAGSKPVGPAHVRGRLVPVQGHLALLAGGGGRVDGELVHVTDPALWERLDAHEGVGEAGWYKRGLVVALCRDEPRSAWAYLADVPAPAP